MAIEIVPAGRAFLRPNGREGRWQRRMEPEHRDPDDLVTCPFDFVKVHGTEAPAALDVLKRMRPETTPMLFGSPHEAGRLFERMPWHEGRNKTPAGWLAEAEQFDVDVWLAEQAVEHEALNVKYADEFEATPRHGPWPDSIDMAGLNRIYSTDDIIDKAPKPVVIIGLLPTPDPTEAAAHLHFGGWNECPRPPVHVCLTRRWQKRYGAVQVANTQDWVEFRVERPLTDRAEALELAMVQFHYCSDSVPETLEVAAAELVGARYWHFWWD